MTIGDLESLENFIYPLMDGMLEYPLLSFIFYSVFLMLMPILLNNLLVCISVVKFGWLIDRVIDW